jgi:hypothetical protein
MGADDDAMVGKTGEPFELRVELGKVREFARATKSKHPEHVAEDGVAPVTFLQTSAFWMTPASNPWVGRGRKLERILHGEQEFTFHGEPPGPGAVLTGTARIDKIYEKEGKRGGTMSFTEMVTEYRDADGRLVAESRSTTIETSKATTEG